MIPASLSFLICFSTPRDDISISIAISAADIVGLFLIKSRILSELFLFLSELFEDLSELSGCISELALGTLFLYFKTDLLDTIQEMTGIILLQHGGSALVCFSVLKRQVT